MREREPNKKRGTSSHRGWAKRWGQNERIAITTLNNLYSGIKKQVMGITAASEVCERPDGDDSDSDPDARGSDEPANEGTGSRQWGSESSRSEGLATGAGGEPNLVRMRGGNPTKSTSSGTTGAGRHPRRDTDSHGGNDWGNNNQNVNDN